MDEQKQIEKFFDLFNKEQGTFTYYTCGLLVVMIGYSFKVVMESTEPYIIFPLVAMLLMFISLGLGVYFLKYRVSNYSNNANILHLKKSAKTDDQIKACIETINQNSTAQSFYFNAHWLTIGIGPLIMFIWLIIIKW